jgi:hypothetical protein
MFDVCGERGRRRTGYKVNITIQKGEIPHNIYYKYLRHEGRGVFNDQTARNHHTPEVTANAVFLTFVGKGGGEEQGIRSIPNNGRVEYPPLTQKGNSPLNTRAHATHHHAPITRSSKDCCIYL